MFILGIQGSPRKKGNSDYLLTVFLEECERFGARTEVIRPHDLDIQPCKELIVCEKKGFCPIKDRMEEMGYGKVRKADVVVLASPVFFYGISAQAKVFIDRCQMFWARRYKLGLKDPARFSRQGFLLSVGASAGKRLFEGVELTARYFFDAISAHDAGSLTYKKVEDAGDIIVRPELEEEIRDAVSHLLTPILESEKYLFVSQGGGRAVMAAAFAGELSKGKIRGVPAGMEGASAPDPAVVTAMAEAGLDVKYTEAKDIRDPGDALPERIVFLGTRQAFEKASQVLPARFLHWEIPDTAAGEDLSVIRNGISGRVASLLSH